MVPPWAFGAETSMFPGELTNFGLAEVFLFLITRLELEPLVHLGSKQVSASSLATPQEAFIDFNSFEADILKNTPFSHHTLSFYFTLSRLCLSLGPLCNPD